MDFSHSSSHSTERGGAIIIMFVMIAIFAALSFAVSSSMRTGAGTSGVSQEKMKLALSEIGSVVEAHRIAIQNMRFNNIPIDLISVVYEEFNPYRDYYGTDNTNCATSACRLYDPAGGGLKWFKFSELHPDLTDVPNEIGQWYMVNGPYWMWVANQGSEKIDMVYNVRVSREFCNFINQQLGLPSDVDSLQHSSIGHFRIGVGGSTGFSTTAHADAFAGTNHADYLAGRREGCFRAMGHFPSGPDNWAYWYYNLIYAQ